MKLTLALAAQALSATAAFAHAPVPGVGAFWNSVAHLFLAPGQLMALLAAGILLGQHAPKVSRWGWPLFIVAVVTTLILTDMTEGDATALLVAGGFAGLLVALSRPLMIPILAVVIGIGVLVGIEIAADDPITPRSFASASGAVFGAALLVAIAGGLAASLSRPWQRIAVRATGSWIAAASLMVLALEFAPRGTIS